MTFDEYLAREMENPAFKAEWDVLEPEFQLVWGFYSESNLKALDKSIQEAEEGKFVVKTMEELRAMEE